MRVLDLGCGPGTSGLTTVWGVSESDEIVGVDTDEDALVVARSRFPERTYLKGSGEALPCGDAAFDRIVSSVAMIYMDVPRTLSELHRVLAPRGKVSLSLLPPSFTIFMMRKGFPRWKPTISQSYAFFNGIWFHCTGTTWRFVNGRTEAFHTERGMRIALRRAGFVRPAFHWRPGVSSKMLIVEAEKS